MNVAAQIKSAVSEASETLVEMGTEVPKFGPLISVTMKMSANVVHAVGQLYWDLSEHPELVLEAAVKFLDVPIAVLEDLKPVEWKHTEKAVLAAIEFVKDADTSPLMAAVEKYEGAVEEIGESFGPEMNKAMVDAGLEDEIEEEVEDDEAGEDE